MESESKDDSLCILYENITPKNEVQIVNEVSGYNQEEAMRNGLHSFVDYLYLESPESSSSSDSDVADDSVCMLQEITRSESAISDNSANSSKDAGNASPPPRNRKKTKIECGICFDGLNEILDSNRTLGSTVCGHLFCNVCMEKSRKNSTQCPTCRKRLGKNQFHPIYF